MAKFFPGFVVTIMARLFLVFVMTKMAEGGDYGVAEASGEKEAKSGSGKKNLFFNDDFGFDQGLGLICAVFRLLSNIARHESKAVNRRIRN